MATVRPGVFKAPPPILRGPAKSSTLKGEAKREGAPRPLDRRRVLHQQGIHPRRRSGRLRRPRSPVQGGLRAISQSPCRWPARVLGANVKVGALESAVEDGFTRTITRSARPAPRCSALYMALGISGPCSTSRACRLGDHCRHQQGPQGADLQLRGLRDGGDIETIVPADQQTGWWSAVKPIEVL